MASVFPLANYHTKHKLLTVNTSVVIYTCGDHGELAFDWTAISVAAKTANADTCTVEIFSVIDNATYTIVFLGPVEADFPLQIELLPIHMVPGDIIKCTATAAATHNLDVHVSGVKTTRAPDARTTRSSDARKG